ncbi:MAG: DUF2752 domain-containing protein [Verrucomicrobiales bacterium]|nr:DUF2752 domain-containing protein [Verrucomicrobiales bacterium]
MTEVHPPVLGRPPAEVRRVPGWPVILLFLGGLSALSLLYFYRPEGQFFFPRCTLYTTTGLLCPTCGGLRATHDLLHGRWLAAWRDNALVVAAIPAFLGWWVYRRYRKPTPEFPRAAIWGIAVVVMLFTILRNLPWPAMRWLSP